MPYLKYEGRDYFARDGETVLDAFLRQGVTVPFSCRNGICQVCVRRCVSGQIPPVAQKGLRPEMQADGYFMTCKCIPLADMEITPPSALYLPAVVHKKEQLAPGIGKLLLELSQPLEYLGGQFINLRRQDGLIRSYSLASLPEDYFLEIHVQRKDGGEMSNWLLDAVNIGDAIDIQGPNGECAYHDSMAASPLLLVGSGTGLSPLLGVLRDALQHQHTEPIHLYHGAREESQLYLRDTLRELERQHPNFHYHESISEAPVPPGIHAGWVQTAAFSEHKLLHGWHIFLAGPVELIDAGEQMAVERGAAPSAIHTDAFALRDLRQGGTRQSGEKKSKPVADHKHDYPPADPELWAALRNGEMLMEVLQDFYGRVFEDPNLSSFFHGVTKQRAIEKQYLFMRQILTGEKIYFGDRPRNAHHWMVISDDLFDYREELMMTCLREHGLTEPMRHRFREVEEFYRRDIVKAAAFPRVIGDIELPLDGFDEIVMGVGTLCDSCQREVAANEKVIYHVRLGKIYCSDCSAQHTHESQSAE